jgi:DeoR family transcriptional regulator, fructose operon transcriptional repressor
LIDYGGRDAHNESIVPPTKERLMAMLLDQRRQEILNIVESAGFVALQQLTERADVSESTIRRDLEYLERIGQIRRTRGGAAYVGESLTTLDERSVQALPEKQAVGRVAAEFVGSGETVLLDGGTTTLEVARHLTGKSLQVVTNSLPVAMLLSNQPQVELILIGGYVYPKTGVALGPLAMSALSQIHVRRLFMSVGGITEKGLFNSNTLLAETERSMLNVAEEVIVVTDSSKLGHSALAHLCPLDRVHRVVVDAGITDEWRKILTNAGIALTIAEV